MATPPFNDGNGRLPAPDDGLASGRKGKKRVGWHSASDSLGASSSKDAAASPRDEISNLSTPSVRGMPQTGEPDALELTIALTKILSEEGQQRSPDVQTPKDAGLHYSDTSPHGTAAQTPNLLRPPRPVLRRNTSYDAPKEREEADMAEQKASQRQVRSMTDARHRADRLAMSVGGYSTPVSRRNSGELNAAFQPLLEDAGDGDEWLGHDDIKTPPGTSHIRHRTPHSSQPQATDNHNVAESLVLSHAMKANKPDFFHRHHKSTSSGTSTPITTDAQDYVPRPTKYRGGILSSLLKLYQDDRGQNTSAPGTEFNSTATTPVMSPRNSPPSSRRPSTAGSSRSRPTSGLFSYHKSQSSTSSLALTELLKSSSMLAVPVSRQISDQWDHKIKKEKSAKPKKEQHRITVHIAGIIARHRYLMKLCRALMMYGAPTHRLEEYMTMSARVLEIESQFLYLPSCMIISFDDSSTHTTEVKLVRVPQGIDLGKLRDVHNIYKHVVHDKLGVEDATKELDEVINRDTKFPVWFRIIMYGVASASVAPFAFEGRFIDLPCAFILGCIVGILQLVFAPSNELYAHVFEVSASIITSFIARGFGSINNGQLFCFSALAQSSIALILPGYIVLCSSLELQSHNLVAGSVRMVYALIYTLFLGYGITIGATLYGMMDSNAASETHCSEPLHRGWYMLFVPCFTLCLCIVNQAKWRQIPAMLVMAVAGYAVNSYTSLYFKGNGQISNMLGALTVGILANLYSRLGRHADTLWLDFNDWWRKNVTRRYFSKRSNRSNTWTGSISDTESATGDTIDEEKRESRRKVGYSLAAAAMLPAIFVQVPSGLAAGGSLLAGITSANEATGNTTTTIDTSPGSLGSMDSTAFNVLFLVIQVAISISVGLFMSALIVYPLGKRRSGLFSF
ncbi:DUF1212 domain membrane protein [Akanthomyces lecanii RCEF 1005]|uniref:DUF1212 domain membrane protein n=1 Tax=Akanthomyces lecanii RCEF 1005 TaxID=1081108 RepID=A0A162ITQ8_CORDF|nr:DUF1212 domain membrane protein [Akanthomyces lecanii RCEF 1005]